MTDGYGQPFPDPEVDSCETQCVNRPNVRTTSTSTSVALQVVRTPTFLPVSRQRRTATGWLELSGASGRPTVRFTAQSMMVALLTV